MMKQHSRKSSSVLIGGLNEGDEAAARQLVDEFYFPVSNAARQKLLRANCRHLDEDDIAQSVFFRFFERARKKAFPDMTNRNGIFKLLLKMTREKAIDQIRRHLTTRKGSGNVRGESVFGDSTNKFHTEPVSAELPAEQSAIFDCEFNELLAKLANDQLREVAVAKYHGFSNCEIAELLTCSLRTIERRIGIIRKTWKLSTS